MPKNTALFAQAYEHSVSKENHEQIQTDTFVTSPRSETPSFKWMFAKSICNANNLSSSKEKETCNSGVPCTKLHACMAQAEQTLHYLDARKSPFPKRRSPLDDD